MTISFCPLKYIYHLINVFHLLYLTRCLSSSSVYCNKCVSFSVSMSACFPPVAYHEACLSTCQCIFHTAIYYLFFGFFVLFSCLCRQSRIYIPTHNIYMYKIVNAKVYSTIFCIMLWISLKCVYRICMNVQKKKIIFSWIWHAHLTRFTLHWKKTKQMYLMLGNE